MSLAKTSGFLKPNKENMISVLQFTLHKSYIETKLQKGITNKISRELSCYSL